MLNVALHIVTISQKVTLPSVAQFVNKPTYQVYDLLICDTVQSGTNFFFKEHDASITNLKRTGFFVKMKAAGSSETSLTFTELSDGTPKKTNFRHILMLYWISVSAPFTVFGAKHVRINHRSTHTHTYLLTHSMVQGPS